MGQMMHGEQGLALLAFTFGMSGFNYPQIKKAAQEFGLSLQHYKELGGTVQGYLEAREEKTAEGFLNKALSHLHDSWMEDPQASMERASAAAGERLSGCMLRRAALKRRGRMLPFPERGRKRAPLPTR